MFKAPHGRLHLSPATAISIVALVFAMTGGAYAITGAGGSQGRGSAQSPNEGVTHSHALVGSTLASESKTKVKIKTGARGPAGPAGKTGPAGAPGSTGSQGPAGPQGPAGANGADGANGANGTSVTSAAASASECGKGGGTAFTSASGTSKVCNGTEGKKGETGAPWPAGGTLPEKAIEKGTWSLLYAATEADQPMSSAISFTIPLEAEPEAHYIDREEQGKSGGPTAPAIKEGKCSGTAEDPEAAPGNLCVFATGELHLKEYLLDGQFPAGNLINASAYGAVVIGESTEEGTVQASGTWAVTG